jgi:hypothetical protein
MYRHIYKKLNAKRLNTKEIYQTSTNIDSEISIVGVKGTQKPL